jgi:hypothetical protein
MVLFIGGTTTHEPKVSVKHPIKQSTVLHLECGAARQAECSSKTLVDLHRTIHCYIPDSIPHTNIYFCVLEFPVMKYMNPNQPPVSPYLLQQFCISHKLGTVTHSQPILSPVMLQRTLIYILTKCSLILLQQVLLVCHLFLSTSILK